MTTKEEALGGVLEAIQECLKNHTKTLNAMLRSLEALDRRISALEEPPVSATISNQIKK